MGILERLMGRTTPPSILTPRVTNVGSWDEWWQTISADLSSTSPAKLFASQPHLRTVVSFRARNIAQLGLHVFERVGESDRRRDRESAVARALAGVDGVMTTYELIFSLVGDLDLYDRAHWLVVPSADLPSGWMLRRLPPSWVTPEKQTAFEVLSWRVTYGKDSVVVPADQILSFTGYSPTDPRRGSPTVESLRDTLSEQIEAALYRSQVWKRGGRVSAVLERPKDAPEWSDEARAKFREDWYAKFTGRGPGAGGTPILEDGMKLSRIDFNAQEQQYVEAAKLSLTTVAAAFHVNPTMIGQNDGANYSNVREFRKMLYGDTLGPLVAQIEARLNAFLLPMLGVDPARFYVEFNIEEKLQGNFEEQAISLQAATGAPWMTRNEARALRNLPRVEGGDELVTPLNVLIGRQASPVDSGSQNRNSAPALPRTKASGSDERKRIAAVFAALIEEADRSLVGFEHNKVAGLVARYLSESSPSPEEFAKAVEALYGSQVASRATTLFAPIFASLAHQVAEVAVAEVGVEQVPDLSKWVKAYTDSHIDMRVRASSATLANIAREAAAEEAANAVTVRMDEWREERPAKTGRWESRQLARGAARESFREAGVTRLRWRTTGSDDCDICRRLDGRVVGIEEPFAREGDNYPAGEGKPPLVVGRSTFHPPIHPGCDCEIDAE